MRSVLGGTSATIGIGRRLQLARARLWARVRPNREAARQLEQLELACDRALSLHAAFPILLEQSDRGTPRKRIFVMGCGRSGTWLLYWLLAQRLDAYVLFEEVDVGRFARIRSKKRVHLLKRFHLSYQTAHAIPSTIAAVWMVRHPFDVLTSHHPETAPKPFHIDPERWNGEMDALEASLGRPNVMVVRYEDLVDDPQGTLARVSARLALAPHMRRTELSNSVVPDHVRAAMHGLRPVVTTSVGRWRSEPASVARLEAVMPLIHDRLRWAAQQFGYHIDLGAR